MGTIFRIFKSDVKGLWRNKLALLIALAICVLPSLYAWFNIYSNWDPYSNTGTRSICRYISQFSPNDRCIHAIHHAFP